MKLHRLELEGFGPFRDRQTIDFDLFDAHGLFLISGRTGAGKSSILDGVCYALYGTAPRYDGGDRGLRSDHSDPHEQTEVRLEFTAAGQRWRVTRSPEYDRPKARGDGMTTHKSAVLIEQLVGGDWLGRTTKYREAGDLLDEILGLNRDQFQQVILLAQNRFAEFLLAKNDDRQALLRTLFGTRRYEDYEKALEQRRRTAQLVLDADGALLQAQLSNAEAFVAENDLAGTADATGPTADSESPAVSDTTIARLSAVQRAVPRARYRADESVRRRDEAEAAHDEALAAFGVLTLLRRRQEERIASRRALSDLEGKAPATAAERLRLERARSAEVVRAPIESAIRARTAAARAAEIEADARAAWTSSGEQDAGAPALRAIVDAIAGDLAVWANAAEVESGLPALDAARARADETVAALELAIAGVADAGVARAAHIARLEPELAEAEETASPVDPARDALESVAARLAAGRDAERLAQLAQAADSAHLAAAAALELASAAVRALLQRRLDGFAGELAGGLVDGEPCPVCGAIEHPHPAVAADEPVTDETIEAAETALDNANRAVSLASADARAARAAHQAAAARAGGDTSVQLEAAHADAQARLKSALAAADEIARLKHELHDLRESDASATREREQLASQLSDAREARAAATQKATAARAEVDAARGAFAAVADRIAAAQRRRALARTLADAADDLARCEVAATAAEVDRDERLAGSDFADAAEASAAMLDAAAQKVLAEQVRSHEVALATERERLFALETELAGAPEELVDLDAAGVTASVAREAWNAAVAIAARDADVAMQLADAASRAAAAHAAAADRQAEYELIVGLADAVAGRNASRMDLETFVLAAELEEIVGAANLRLDAMSSGRYLLQHTDAVGARRVASGLGIAVLDAYTGQARPAQSLSGGETFLASLALALGLAEIVTARAGGVRLDTLFIDEGFGSLDDETLDLAMRTLDELREGGRTVGLISHVAAMKEQLPAQLVVESTPQGPSVIRQTTAVPV